MEFVTHLLLQKMDQVFHQYLDIEIYICVMQDLERLRHHVQKGKGWSMALLAQRYQNGVGVTQSWEQALHFHKMGFTFIFIFLFYV